MSFPDFKHLDEFSECLLARCDFMRNVCTECRCKLIAGLTFYKPSENP